MLSAASAVVFFYRRIAVSFVRQASDIDIGFPAGAGDEHLLIELRRVLPEEFAQHPPDLVLFGERARGRGREREREGRVAGAWGYVRRRRRNVRRPVSRIVLASSLILI